jgi:CubicO group peptidase (beta-lactamase class C family)
MGGVTGHSGLFSSARDLNVFLSKIRDCWLGHDPYMPSSLLREAFTRDRTIPYSSRTIGWDTPAATGSQAGTRFSKNTIGHLGFTGTSMWLDLEKNVHVILLSNRIHPSRENEKIKAFRPLIHDLVLEAVEETRG